VNGRSIAVGIAAGLAASVLLMSAVSGSVAALFLVGFTPLPLFAAGLSQGVRTAVIAGLVTTLVHFSVSGVLGAGMFVLICVGPVVLLVRQSLLWRQTPDQTVEWYPPGLLVHWASLYAAGLFLVASLVAMGSGSGLESRLARLLDVAMAERMGMPAVAEVRMVLEWFAAYPATILALWLINLTVNAALAQALLIRFGWALRPAPRMADLALPRWHGPITALLVVLAYLGDGWLEFTMRNLLVIQGFAYLMAGLAVFHAVASRFSSPTLPLAALYGLVSMLVWPCLAIVLVGFIEQWAHLRLRLERSQRGRNQG